jgi:hypothetical protein
MNPIETEKDIRASLPPRTGSASALCQWHTGSGTKRAPIQLCGKPADWRKRVLLKRGREETTWSLCDHHKQLIVGSFNEKYQAIENMLWTPIKRQSSYLSASARELPTT